MARVRILGTLEAMEQRDLASAEPSGYETRGKLNLTCPRCGYGAVRSRPPERCPMCQAENAWVFGSSRFAPSLQLTR